MQILKHLVYSYVLMLLLISHMAVFLCNDETVSKKENIICPEVFIYYYKFIKFSILNINSHRFLNLILNIIISFIKTLF